MRALLNLVVVLALSAVPAKAQLPTWAESACAPQENSLECHVMHRAYNPARFYLWPNNVNEARRFVDLRPQWMADEDWQVCQRQHQWDVPGDRDNASGLLTALMHGPNRYDEHNRLLLSIVRGGQHVNGHFAFYVEGQAAGPYHQGDYAWSLLVGQINHRGQSRHAQFARGDLRLNVRRVLSWLRHEEVRLALFQTNRSGLALVEFAAGHGLPQPPPMRNPGANRLTLWYGNGIEISRTERYFQDGSWSNTNRRDWLTMTCGNAEF